MRENLYWRAFAAIVLGRLGLSCANIKTEPVDGRRSQIVYAEIASSQAWNKCYTSLVVCGLRVELVNLINGVIDECWR